MLVVSISFYFVGYGFSHQADGGLFGTGFYYGVEDSEKLSLMVFSFSFCSTASTIISGSLAERSFIDSYAMLSMLISSIVYPVAAAWVWGDGWL